MPELKNFGESNREMNVKKIETEDQFWLFIRDARNKFGVFRLLDEESDEDLVQFRDKRNFPKFNEILRDEKVNISGKILNNEKARKLISVFDDLIKRIRTFKTRAELDQILEESDEYFERYNLGIDESEEYNQFNERINDMKGQIYSFRIMLSMNLPLEKIMEEQKNLKTFEECLKSYNEELPPDVKNNPINQELIKLYDDIINRLRISNTTDEIKLILEEAKKVLDGK
jgi:hypothetical protein